ncbi:MAG: hypothetical protein ACXWTY_11960 [Methylobacter sp.]|jgi:hypothetical protein
MNTTIDTAMARRMAGTSVIQGASIIGHPGGWGVMLKLGNQEKPLGVQRTDKPRLWRSLDNCVEFLKTELHINKIDLDASKFSNVEDGKELRKRPDASERLRKAFKAADHDKWFKEQVKLALVEANDPNTQWVSQEDAKASWATKRAELVKRAGRNA